MMAEQSELDLKVLERTAEQLEASRSAFFRDLKFSLPLLLVFQFLVYSRFTKLSADKDHVAVSLAANRRTLTTLTNLEARLGVLKATADDASREFKTEIEGFPAMLRTNFVELQSALIDLTNGQVAIPPVGVVDIEPSLVTLASEVPNSAFIVQGTPLQRGAVRRPDPRGRFLVGLKPDELRVLQRGVDDRNYTELVTRIVEERIIQPQFESLNADWHERVVAPFMEKRTKVLEIVHGLGEVKESGMPAGSISTNLQKAGEAFTANPFQAPKEQSWWTTLGGKVA